MLQVGSILGGRLRIERILGAGGMGVVAAATHLELHQQVAVKVLRDELAENATIVERFLREARAVAVLRTDHVCRVFDVGRLDSGAPYIVMELLQGSDLGSAIARGPLPVATAVEYIVQACVALREAHAAGIIHRDLKPANLFVTRRPDGGPLIKVLDFGIAKATGEGRLTATASMMGSPGYMSPEQLVSAHDVDVRTDVWALGVTLYQLVSGRMPFPADKLAEIAVKVQAAAPEPLDVDPGLRAIVLRCLDKDPERRFSDVGALVTALLPFGGAAAQRFAMPASSMAVSVPAPTVARDAPTAAGSQAVAVITRSRAPSPDLDVPARRGRGALIAIALVLVVGGGLAAAWRLRGQSAPQAVTPARDAAIVAVATPDAAPIAVAPATVAAPPDAAPADAAPADAPPPPDAALPPEEATSQPDVRSYLMGKDMHAKMVEGLRGAEAGLKKMPKDSAYRATVVLSVVQMACMAGDAEKAARYFAEVKGASDRVQVRRTCSALHIKLPE